MSDKREPILMCVVGTKGVGKSYTTEKSFDSYIRYNPVTGKKGRKILIFDVNEEFTKYRTIDIKDIKKFTQSPKIEIRRVLPRDKNGKPLKLDQMQDVMSEIINNFRGGLVLLEDINRYMIQAKTADVIGVITTNRHRDLDIICHYQSLSALDPRMWQNSYYIRFHRQADKIARYKDRIPNYELFQIAENIIANRYTAMKDPRFFVYVNNLDNFIAGDYGQDEFDLACKRHLISNEQKMIRDTAIEYSCSREDAISRLVSERREMYFKGKPSKTKRLKR